MADEPRRSGRATKGQHTKDREENETSSKGKGKGKGKKGKAAPEPEEEEDEEEDELIRCICGKYEEEEDDPRSMICCDKCSAWQHNDCMGLPEDYSPEKYFCEQCRPSDHKELLAAIKRGEKPWEDAELRREEAKAEKASKKKGKKGGRKSASRVSDVQQRTPTLEPEEPTSSKKRKHEESPGPEVAVKSKRARSSLRESTNGAVEDSVEDQLEEQPTDQPEEHKTIEASPILANVAKDAKEITDPTRSRIAGNIVKSFIEQANALVQNGALSLAKGETAKSLGAQVGLQVEHAVYFIRSGGSGEPSDAYKDHMRSILNNIKTNADLAVRLMSKKLGADELAAMEAKDMATDEQKQKDADEKLRMDKQHVLVDEQSQGPRIRRTHKGDEYVDGSGQPAESVTSNAPVRKPGATADQDTVMKSPTPADKPSVMRKPSASTKGRPFGDARRKSSTNFDIDKVWSGVQGSPTEAEAPKLPEVPQRGSPPPMVNTADADPEVDRLLKDEENESEPYSPKDSVEEGVIWSGSVNGGSLGIFHTVARFAAGCQPNCDNLRLSWGEVIPPEIKLHGRIQPSKADDYLCGLEYSETTELIIVSLAEPKDSDHKKQFEKFFNYLKTKDRYGVGSQHQLPAVKDIYLLPMEVGQPLPTVVKALEHSLADPITERSFLVPIVIKWTELPHNAERNRQRQMQLQQQQAQSPSVGPPVAQTPITPHEPQSMQFDIPAPQYSQAQAPVNGGAVQLPDQTQAQPQTSYSTPPPVSQTQMLSQQATAHAPVQVPASQSVPTQSPASLNALRVLGPELAASQSVIDLIAQYPQAGENEFNIIKECIEENAEAGRSLAVLTQMLQAKYQGRQAKQGQGQGQQGQGTVVT